MWRGTMWHHSQWCGRLRQGTIWHHSQHLRGRSRQCKPPDGCCGKACLGLRSGFLAGLRIAKGPPLHRQPGLSRIRVGGCCAGLLLRVCPGVSRLGCLLGLSTSNLGAGGCLAGRHQAALTAKTDLQTDSQMAGRVHKHHGRWCEKLRWHRSEHEQLTPLTYL